MMDHVTLVAFYGDDFVLSMPVISADMRYMNLYWYKR
jgi:hypothetical protein